MSDVFVIILIALGGLVLALWENGTINKWLLEIGWKDEDEGVVSKYFSPEYVSYIVNTNKEELTIYDKEKGIEYTDIVRIIELPNRIAFENEEGKIVLEVPSLDYIYPENKIAVLIGEPTRWVYDRYNPYVSTQTSNKALKLQLNRLSKEMEDLARNEEAFLKKKKELQEEYRKAGRDSGGYGSLFYNPDF